MDGLTVLQHLRERKNTHVVILTAKDAVGDRVRGLQQGADDYLVKPFAFEELLARVQALCRRSYLRKSSVLVIGPLEIDLARRSAHCKGTTLVNRWEWSIRRRWWIGWSQLRGKPGQWQRLRGRWRGGQYGRCRLCHRGRRVRQ